MKFWRNLLSFWRSWKTQFFWVGHFEFFFSKKKIFFCFIPMKTCQSLLVSKDFSKFWWLPWFPAPNSTCLNICNTVYALLNYVEKYYDTNFNLIISTKVKINLNCSSNRNSIFIIFIPYPQRTSYRNYSTEIWYIW